MNISEKQRAAGSPPSGVALAADRPLLGEVLEELTSWNPREFIAAFGRWHHGAISLVHLNVLILLEAEGPLPMGRLAAALDVSVASATGIVDRMEKRGLVERRHDATDRRLVLVHPAPGARDVFGDIDGRRRAGLAKLLDRLTDEELAALLRGHRALRAARAAIHEGVEDAAQNPAQNPAQGPTGPKPGDRQAAAGAAER